MAAVLYLLFLGVVFVAMARVSLNMAYGPAPEGMSMKTHEPWWSVLAPGLLGLPVLVLGLYVPKGLQTFLEHAAQGVGVR